MQHINTVFVAVLAFVLILIVGRNTTAIITLIIAIAGTAAIAFTTVQMEFFVLLLPYYASVAGSIFTAMVLDKTSADKYGLAVGGMVGLSAGTDIIAVLNPALFSYLQEESPQYLYLCAVIPAMILLVSLIVFISSRKVSQ
jgi:hypothetical protein